MEGCVWRSLELFLWLIYFLEDEGLLDILNDIHVDLFTLPNVFISKINERLIIWQGAWNHHRIRTVNSTPMRLYTAGMMDKMSAQIYDVLPQTEAYSSCDEDRKPLDNRPVLTSLQTVVHEGQMRRLREQSHPNLSCIWLFYWLLFRQPRQR